MDRVFKLAREYGAAVICLTIDEEGQARDADWKLRVAERIYDIAVERYGLEPDRPHLRRAHVPALDRRRRPAPRRDGDDRGDPAHQGRAARRVDDPRPVERVVRPEARGPPRAQQRVPARVPRGRPRRGDRARGADHAAATDRRAPARGRARPDLRPARRDELRPAHRVHGAVRRRRRGRDREGGPLRLAGRRAAEAPHHRRRPRRPRGRPRRALADAVRRSRSSTTSCSTA